MARGEISKWPDIRCGWYRKDLGLSGNLSGGGCSLALGSKHSPRNDALPDVLPATPSARTGTARESAAKPATDADAVPARFPSTRFLQ